MAVLDTLVTAGVGAAATVVGVVVGGVVTRRAQDRQWLRDKQLAAYVELLSHYAKFTIIISRAHYARGEWDYDWGAWSAALTTSSLVAPSTVAAEIDRFGYAIDGFLKRVNRERNSINNPLNEQEFEEASRAPAAAQLALINVMRRSLGKDQGNLKVQLGGAQARPEHWPQDTQEP